ncbi:MAG TPA: hypothetical protein VKM55_21320 [Candidatus Lokiarchaeia archaeon]|nr:hypothetical protein [Candidatus Lokiarchaeia archaeon]
MVDKKNALTSSVLWPSTITTQDRSIPLPANLDGINPNNFKYILGIFAPAKDFLKITSYYLNSPSVTKITFVFDVLDDDMLKAVSLFIKDFKEQPIHVSGFCMKNGKYIYELYTSGKRQVANRIVQSLKKSVPGFESTIEEISLQIDK